MSKTRLYLAMTAALIGVSGCSTTPDTSSSADLDRAHSREAVADQEKLGASGSNSGDQQDVLSASDIETGDQTSDASVEHHRYSTQDRWSSVVMAPERPVSESFEAAGVDASWIENLPESEAQALLSRLQSSILHVVHDEHGEVHRLYGKDLEGEYVNVACKGGLCGLVEPKGFVAETTITLSVGQRGSVDRLGKPQQLALRKLMQEVPDENKVAFAKGDVSLSFKALFMNGKLVGPTQIVEAKSRFEGKEITFPSEK